MAFDKLVDSAQLDSDLTSVADAIRAKSGGSSQLAFPAGFVSEIQAIHSGGEIQHFSYVAAADKTSVPDGSTKAFADTYFNQGNGIYWANIDSTYVSQYKAVFCIAIMFSDLTTLNTNFKFFKRPANFQPYVDDGGFYYIAGDTIDVYYIPESYVRGS